MPQATRCASTAVERHRLAPSRRLHQRSWTSMVATLVDLRRYGCQGTLPVVRTFSFAEKVGKENILVCSVTCSTLARHVGHQPTHAASNPACGLGTYGSVLVRDALLPMTSSYVADPSTLGTGNISREATVLRR